MALSRERATYDPDRIQSWAAADKDVEDLQSVASRLSAECIKSFKIALKNVISHKKFPVAIIRKLERGCSTLTLWASGYGVTDGNIDDAMANSRTLRRSILELLSSVGSILSGRLIPQLNIDEDAIGIWKLKQLVAEANSAIHDGRNDEETDDSGSDSSSDSGSDDIDEIAEDLKTDTRCLMDLDALIKTPAKDSAREHLAIKLPQLEWTPHQPYLDRIRHRFPQAGLDLAERLAKANWDRFQRTQSEKNSNTQLQVQQPVDSSRAAPTERGSKFNDSGLGSSLNTGSAYAETVMSYSENGGHSVRIPPLSTDAKQGLPFDCIACGRKVNITNNSAWKKHLYLDLRPWLCHDVACKYGTEPFVSREDWIHHLALDHQFSPEWKSFDCPLCLEPTGDSKMIILRHLSSHLEEVSLASLPAGAESDIDSDTDSRSEAQENIDEEALKLCEACNGYCASYESVGCSICKNTYHMDCISPPMLRKPLPSAGWTCPSCPSLAREMDSKLSDRNHQPYDEAADTNHDSTPDTFTRHSCIEMGCVRRTRRPGNYYAGNGTTSYWDVDDVVAFPSLLKEYGQDWEAIASQLRDKTATMVKFYHDNPKPHREPGLEVAKADESDTGSVVSAEILPVEAALFSDGTKSTYCYCDKPSYGEMIACRSNRCPREWFHLGCTELTSLPLLNHKWFCRDCELGTAPDRANMNAEAIHHCTTCGRGFHSWDNFRRHYHQFRKKGPSLGDMVLAGMLGNSPSGTPDVFDPPQNDHLGEGVGAAGRPSEGGKFVVDADKAWMDHGARLGTASSDTPSRPASESGYAKISHGEEEGSIYGT